MFTEGEWILDFSEEHNGVISVYVPKKGTVAKIFTRSNDDYKANAHLIAAAPDLYEALKRLNELLYGANLPFSDNMFEAKIKAREAIAKAEGK